MKEMAAGIFLIFAMIAEAFAIIFIVTYSWEPAKIFILLGMLHLGFAFFIAEYFEDD